MYSSKFNRSEDKNKGIKSDIWVFSKPKIGNTAKEC